MSQWVNAHEFLGEEQGITCAGPGCQSYPGDDGLCRFHRENDLTTSAEKYLEDLRDLMES